MQAFEYASPNSKEQVAALLGSSWEQGAILAGGTDLLALMKDDVVTPKRLVNLKGIDALHGTSYQPGNGLRNTVSRIEALKGHVIFDTQTGEGTRLQIEIPLS